MSPRQENKYIKGVILYRLEEEQLLGYLPIPKELDYITFSPDENSPDEKFLVASYSTGGGGDPGGLFVTLSSSPKPSWSHLVAWRLVPLADKYYPSQVAKIKSKKDIYPPLVFTPDGKFLVSSGIKKIRFWQVPPLKYTWLSIKNS